MHCRKQWWLHWFKYTWKYLKRQNPSRYSRLFGIFSVGSHRLAPTTMALRGFHVSPSLIHPAWGLRHCSAVDKPLGWGCKHTKSTQFIYIKKPLYNKSQTIWFHDQIEEIVQSSKLKLLACFVSLEGAQPNWLSLAPNMSYEWHHNVFLLIWVTIQNNSPHIDFAIK